MVTLRRLLSILLLAVFGLPVVAPALAQTGDESKLPACCRRAGKHHCAMAMAADGTMVQSAPGFSAALEKCPYCPASVMAAHTDVLGGPVLSAELLSREHYFAGVAQTESLRRISQDRSRQKRGPPQLA